MAKGPAPSIVLFGYESSPFTWKIRMALQLRQIPYTFILVPSMMPRPILLENFNLTYRKIPVMCIGKELYIDTSLILEAIALHPYYPPSKDHPPLHPSPQHRTLTRLLSSHYTDRPLFRLTTGLIPQTVWQTSFGTDRASLIGHKLNPDKLGAKVPRNLAALDTYLSILEPLFSSTTDNPDSSPPWTWFLGTPTPTAADISLYYQLHWGMKISRGDGIHDLTGGGTPDGSGEGMTQIFNADRYPGLYKWYIRVQRHFSSLPTIETKIQRTNTKSIADIMSTLNATDQPGPIPLLPIPGVGRYDDKLDQRNGLVPGTRVSVTPDDTGRDDPTFGTLVGITVQEVVIVPDLIGGRESRVRGVRVHFPRVGFVVMPIGQGGDGDGDRDGKREVRVTVLAGPAKL